MVDISLEALNFSTIIPMLIIITGGLIILGVDLFTKNTSRSFYTIVSVLFILLDLGFVLYSDGFARGFFDLMLVDGISIISQSIILLASALFIPLALTSKRYHEYSYPEFYALFLFMIAGFQFMVSSDSLILIFVGLETASLALYCLIALHNRTNSFEAAIKYFIMGAYASGFFAFGSMMIYAATGTLEIAQISLVLIENGYEPSVFLMLGFVFLLAAIGFKISIVPFHTWTPDVYEGSSAALAGYMSIVPKIAGFIVALRFFEILVSSNLEWVNAILYVAVVATMTIPNLLALVQEDVKRMLAYSSISHAGFALAAILIGSTQSHTSLFLYWILFLFTNVGAFTMLWVSRHKAKIWHDRFDHPYSKFSGMVKIMPVGASLMAIFMLSLAGVPPFAVFWGKMYLMGAALSSEYIILAIIMAINSAIAAYYYLKLIVYMFLKDPITTDSSTVYMTSASTVLKTVIGFSAVITTFSIFLIGPLLDILTKYVMQSGF